MTETAIPGLVRRLLIHEAGNAQNAGAVTESAERVCEKLRVHLTTRIGRDGFRTLMVRALTLAAAQFPLLCTVLVTADGTLEGLLPALSNAPQNHDEQVPAADEGAVALVEHLTLLLVTFIGYDLTLRILSTVWPLFHENDLSGQEEKIP